MKTKALFSFLLLAAQFPFTALADVWQDPETMVNYEYTVKEKEASVGDSFWASGNITIRSKFTVDGNEYNVTRIGDRAFQWNPFLTSITFPSSLISIGTRAFYGCHYLTSVTMANSVTSIGSSAFCDCSSLTDILLSENLTSIEAYSFSKTDLKNVNIPNNVRIIGTGAFAESSLERITLGNGLISIEYGAFMNTHLQEVEIPDQVETIGKDAFSNNQQLRKVKLGKGIINMDFSFRGCEAIEEIISEISHPKDIQDYDYTFAYECYRKAKLYLPPYMINLYKELKGWKNFVNMIGENFPEDLTIHVSTPGTLRNNIERENIQYTHTLKVTGQINGDDILTLREMTGRDMDNKAILGCLRKLDLSEVDIVDGGGCYFYSTSSYGTAIGTHANVFPSLSFCFTKLEEVKLPNSAKTVGAYAFLNCSNLKNIDFGTGITKLDYCSFRFSGVEEITIADQISDVEEETFSQMGSLKVVHLNTKLQTFGGLLSNFNLKEIYAPYQNPPSIIFESPQTRQNITLYIPKGLSRIYKDHGWYFNTIQEMEDYALPMPFMVTTLWSQNSPYNNLCPGNAAAGCGAIAVAQILNYYQRPAHGFGHVKYGNVDMDFESYPIEWDAIGNIYGETYTTAVARLVAQVGAAMKMQYKTSGSSPVSHASMMWGLQHYLHFSPKSRYHRRLFYSTPEWLEMLNNELEAARPVFYRGDHPYKNGVSYEWAGGTPYTGHMYVIDGRNEDGLYHVNFGHASMSQDKFANLNIINQSADSIVDGKNTISYHHRQAMVTDFYPVDGLTDADYEQANIVLTSPIVVNGDATPRTMKLSDKVSVHFSYRPVNFENTVLDIGIGFYNNDNLVAIADGYVKSLQFNDEKNREFSIRFEKPNGLSNGNYEICVITRVKGTDQWFKAWDCAPNIIPARIENGVLFLDIPNFHNREASLQLVGEPIFKDNFVEFTLANMSDNNFEEIIRYTYSLPSEYLAKTISNYTSIYENQQVTYRFESPSLEKLTSFDIIYWNGEKNISLLHPETESIREKERSHKNFSGVEIYTIDGVLVKRVSQQNVDTTYGTVLGSLPKGVYVVRDKNGTRKYVKRQ